MAAVMRSWRCVGRVFGARKLPADLPRCGMRWSAPAMKKLKDLGPIGVEAERHAPGKQAIADGLHFLVHVDGNGAKVYRTVMRASSREPEKIEPYHHNFPWSSDLLGPQLDGHNHPPKQSHMEPHMKKFLTAVERVIEQADEVILVGHGTGKASMLELLVKHMHEKRHDLEPKIAAVIRHENTHHITDPQLLKLAREHYRGEKDPRRLPRHVGA
ncbi:hypothetical protein FVE85_4958 [Porphyridium purpureum]|uniref:Uncharacterized protein n=1 Tax=Porphyridium purpureum TaxID=35688 RepID=A0A5J4YQN1_PORPP|nr:hypothetical protein FVE85_4958 [Porphyridium purpureum]|eukprot:POR8414..scf236_6